MFSLLLLLVITITLPASQWVVGWTIYSALKRALRKTEAELPGPSLCIGIFIVGMLAQLLLVLIGKCMGFSWALAVVLGVLPAIVSLRNCPWPVADWRLSLNFLLWFTVHVFLGASLFAPRKGIETMWINSYGDLAFHAGMIASFVFGDNFPPQYHLYPGTSLSYPLFVNLWTAMQWWPHPTPWALSWIFFGQWMIVWTIIYYAVNGDRRPLLPWVILFGGGTYHLFYARLGGDTAAKAFNAQAHELIGDGIGWVPFMTTIWMVQRAACMGAMILLAAVRLFHEALDLTGDERRDRLLLTGLLLGLSPLAHTHLCLAGVLYVTAVAAGGIARQFFKARGEFTAPVAESCKDFALMAAGMSSGLLALPFISGKASIVGLMYGWHSGSPKSPQWLAQVLESAKLWLINSWQWLLAFALVGYRTRAAGLLAALAVIFCVLNFVRLAVWPWDQIKLFLGVYLIMVAVWSRSAGRTTPAEVTAAVLLMIPAVFETGRVLVNFPHHTVFTSEELELAERIRNFTPKTAIIAAKPDHNSPVVLTGRPFFMGYDGTLYSHNILYQDRQKMNSALDQLVRCKADPANKICPEYILWTNREKEYWKGAAPLTMPELARTAVAELFKIK